MNFETWSIAFEPEPGWYACNPSIAQGPEGYACLVTCRDLMRGDDGLSYTFADSTGLIRTRNYFAELDEDLNPLGWTELPGPDGPHLGQVLGIEDPRLNWDESWKYTGSIFEHDGSGVPAVAVCSVEKGIEEILTRPAKNLMPASGLLLDVMAHDPDLHGGAVTRYGQGYLAIAHGVEWPGRVYHHCFVKFDAMERVRGRSSSFRFGTFPIEFAAGIVLHGDDVVVSYGVQDREARLARFSLNEVTAALCGY